MSDDILLGVLRGLLARMRFKGWSYSDLSEILHKEPATVKKQLSESYFLHINLATLMEYVAALGGWIVYETEEDKSVVVNNSEIDELRSTIAVLGSQNDELKNKLEDREATIANLRQRNGGLQEKLSTVIESNAKMANALCDISMKLSDKI